MDIDIAKSLNNSIAWAGVCRELDNRISIAETRLRRCSVDELKEIQIRVNTLEEIKNLPKDVIEREE